MAQPIEFHLPPKHTISEAARLHNAPEQHAAAVISAYDLLQALHDQGVLELLRGLVSARDDLTDILASAVNNPESIRGIRNFLLLTRFLAGVPPEMLHSLAETTAEGAERAKSHNPPGLFHLLWRLRDRNSRHAMAMMLDLLQSVGKGL
jgi:uncharacterized protein YjgD (DUF1641 family)